MNYIQYLKKRYSPSAAMDRAETPVDRCRAPGGPGTCSVHGPMLKNELSSTDDVKKDDSGKVDISDISDEKYGLFEDADPRLVRRYFADEVESDIYECDANDAVAKAARELAGNSEVDVYGASDRSYGEAARSVVSFKSSADGSGLSDADVKSLERVMANAHEVFSDETKTNWTDSGQYRKPSLSRDENGRLSFSFTGTTMSEEDREEDVHRWDSYEEFYGGLPHRPRNQLGVL